METKRSLLVASVAAGASVLLFLLSGCGSANRTDSVRRSCTVLQTNRSACTSHPGIYAIWHIVVDPRHPQTVYIESNTDVLKSTDGGSSWSRLDPWGDWGISQVELDPRRPDTVYVSTNAGLYRSTDGGSSWTHSLGSHYVYGIGIGPQAGVLYASVAKNCSLSCAAGYFDSTDGGASWKALDGLPPTSAYAYFDPYHPHRHHFGVDVPGYQRDTGALAFSRYAEYAAGTAGVYEKLNTGTTWRLVVRVKNFQAFAVSANGRVLYASADGATRNSPTAVLYRFRLSGRG
jgi:hypothetical protein